MNQRLQAVHSFRISSHLAALLLLIAVVPSQGQQGGSLADAARQVRAEKQAQPKSESGQAQQIADQLAEDQTGGDAPAGFKMYKADGYKLIVPAPYSVVGHDEAGVIVAGVQMRSTQLYILVGNPIMQHWGNNDDAFHDAAVQFARLYSPNSICAKDSIANREAYQCSLAGAKLLETSVSGNAVFVKSRDRIYPVFCTAKTDSRERDILNDPHAGYEVKLDAKAALEREDQDVRVAWQKCGPVLQSIQILENVQAAQPSPSKNSRKAEAAPPGLTSAVATSGSPNASLAQVALQLHQGNTSLPILSSAPSVNGDNPTENLGPPGTKVHSFNYCKSSRDCWDASFFVPVEAQQVSSNCKQFVFEMKVQGSAFLLLAGTAGADNCAGRAANDPSLLTWNQLVLPETRRAPGTYSTISSLQTKVDGKPAVLTTIGFRKGLEDWIGKRVELENNGVPLVFGCMGPKEHFADGDAICSGLIESLRLP